MREDLSCSTVSCKRYFIVPFDVATAAALPRKLKVGKRDKFLLLFFLTISCFIPAALVETANNPNSLPLSPVINDQ